MLGNFYIQRRSDGSPIEKPKKNIGSISVDNKKLYCFENDYLVLELLIQDFKISKDGIMLMGIQELNNRKIWQEIWFIPKLN